MVTVNVERRRYDVEKMSEPRETAVRREFFWYLMWRERGLFLRRLCRSTVTRSLGVAYNLQSYIAYEAFFCHGHSDGSELGSVCKANQVDDNSQKCRFAV